MKITILLSLYNDDGFLNDSGVEVDLVMRDSQKRRIFKHQKKKQ